MEFWGVEVKAGELLKVKPDDGYSIIHLSQAALGESKKEKGNESATLFVKINNKKIVLGTLSYEKIPQLSFDLVFEKEVELSHSLKNGSIYVCGYQSALPDDDEEDMYSEDEPVPLVSADNAVQLNANAKPATAKSNVAKPDSSSKQKVTPVQPSKNNEADNESDDDDEDESHEEDESEEGMSVDEDSDDEDDSESEDEETPKKAEKGAKRPNDSAAKTPVPSKKQKSASPQKTEGKKGGHTATPHPAKGAAKGLINAQTLKSGGRFKCNSCDWSFVSEPALQFHSKARHGK